MMYHVINNCNAALDQGMQDIYETKQAALNHAAELKIFITIEDATEDEDFFFTWQIVSCQIPPAEFFLKKA